MHARTRLVLTQPTKSDARCEALFAAALQPSSVWQGLLGGPDPR
jgi:hypothetical protein